MIPTQERTSSGSLTVPARRPEGGWIEARRGGAARTSERRRAEERRWSVYTAHRDDSLREQLIESYRPLVIAVLRRMGRAQDEDLEQVAWLALVHAVDRFDPANGTCFSSFAVPTIDGAMRRYLRDQSRVVRPPRPLLDLRCAVHAKEIELTARNGRMPSVAMLANALCVDTDRVQETLSMEERCHPRSLDRLVESADHDSAISLEDTLGEEDGEMARVEDRVAWRQEIHALDPRLRQIIKMRYYGNLSQQEAARRLGISQMHVSRLERRALDRLRGHMAGVGC